MNPKFNTNDKAWVIRGMVVAGPYIVTSCEHKKYTIVDDDVEVEGNLYTIEPLYYAGDERDQPIENCLIEVPEDKLYSKYSDALRYLASNYSKDVKEREDDNI